MTTTAASSLTGSYLLDPARTRIGFVARQAMLGKVRGAFTTYDGRAHLDFAEPSRSSAEVTIDVGSLTTGNARRDKHLRTGFFDAASHPRITFRSTQVELLADDRVRLTGELTIKGWIRPVRIELVSTGADLDPDGTSRVAFSGRGVLNRKDWGVAWSTTLEGGGALVSKTILVELEVQLVKSHDESLCPQR